jgi:amino acid adenylation domain-containing protein
MINFLHEFIIPSVSEFADRTAVSCGNSSITYGDLDEKSNKLANLLLHLGVKRGDRVGLLTNKNIEAIISIIAVLKTGAAFVPLNDNMIATDLDFIINDCGIKLLISDKTIKKILDYGEKITNLTTIISTVDDEDVFGNDMYFTVSLERELDRYPDQKPVIKIIGNDLAYIFYTSGSTGRAKGVMISHSSIVLVVDYRRKYLGFNHETIALSLSPLYFDPVINEIFCTLSVGGKLILINSNNSVVLYRGFLSAVQKEPVSIFFCVPSFLNMLISSLRKLTPYLGSVKYIVFGAGSCPIRIIQELKRLLPGTDFIHGYGLTETSVTACSYRIIDPFAAKYESFPLGEPIPNTEFYVLDDDGHIVSNGVGELVIRGPHLMKGYWNNKTETDKVLKINPIFPEQNEKVLFTGDLVRVEVGGDLIFVGRKDDQIKSAGHRIELGEVEMRISRYEGVKEVCVIPVPDLEMGNKIKCILSLEHNYTLNDVIQYCNSNLVLYTIPHLWELMDEIPKNQNGKIDKKLLKEKV